MSNADSSFAGSIPAIYQELMVPMLFQDAAQDMARRVAALHPERVLETAAGTGVVTRALAALLPEGARLVATDLNPAMLAICEAGLARDGRISFQAADMQALPFAKESFDLVVCQFGVMFLPDKPLGYREARRVLAPGGRYLFSVWDGLGSNDFARVVSETLAGLFPQDPPRFFERTPHGHHDMEPIVRQLSDAGFGHVVTEAVEGTSTSPSARSVATAYCQGTPMRGEIEARGGSLDAVTAAVTEALERRFGQGRIEGPIRWFVIAAEV